MSTNRASRIVMVFGGRFPGEKAAAIFADLQARSFVAVGREVVVLAPRRFRRGSTGHAPYRIVFVPVIDLIYTPFLNAFAGYFNSLSFAISTSFWFFFRGKASDIVFSNENVPLLALTFFSN